MSNERDEEVQGKAYDRVIMRRLLTYLRPYRAHIGISVILLLVVAGLRLAGPYLTKIAIDNFIVTGDVEGLHKVGIAYTGVLVSIFICRYIQIYLTNLAGQRVMYDIRVAVYRHLQKLSVAYYDRNPVGRLITRVTNDIEALNEMFSSGVVNIFGDIFSLIGIMAVMITLDWKLALVSFAVLPLLTYSAGHFRSKVRSAYREVRAIVSRLNAHLQESITGMHVTQLFNRQERNFGEFEDINREHQDAYIRTIRYYAIFFPAVEVIGALAVGSIIWYGGGQVVQGAISLGVLVAFLQYAQQFFQPISNLSEQYNTMQAAMAASERLFVVLDEKPSVSDSEHPVVLGRPSGRIEFRGVWFSYNEPEWVLKDVNFTVEPGQRVAFVGATGAGKSTIINLICRFYDPQRGQVLIDGVDIRTLSQQELRKYIGLVLQDVFLFSGTIEDNIRLWNDTVTFEDAREAAVRINAHPFVSRLPEGYAASLGERGSNLSTGQRQLISFARALAYDPAILVLDEATSSIDTETERLIQDALRTLMANRTSLIVAHRLSTIQDADQIIVLHRGQIHESGAHRKLLDTGGLYTRLYQLQYREQESVSGE
ncbi:MAG: ABC transporter ATP-binding protein [candidate division Zixibacteria bacterium]|nr:ABC transporter ATP-binding protein [candidate division Zixibacteria bacterium]